MRANQAIARAVERLWNSREHLEARRLPQMDRWGG